MLLESAYVIRRDKSAEEPSPDCGGVVGPKPELDRVGKMLLLHCKLCSGAPWAKYLNLPSSDRSVQEKKSG